MVGGFLITDRMLRMFKTGKAKKSWTPFAIGQLIDFAYIAAAVLFILSLKCSARGHGTSRSDCGEIVRHLLLPRHSSIPPCAIQMDRRRLIVGAAIGIPLGMVRMTPLPSEPLSATHSALCPQP